MVAVDAAGLPVRISGAALAGGPLLAIAASRRPPDPNRISGTAGGSFPAYFRRTAEAASPTTPGDALATQPDTLPARWGIPTFFAGAPYGPPYELENRTAEWLISAETSQTFFSLDRQARMANRVHPRGPMLQSSGAFLSALFGTTPAPRSLGLGIDAIR